MTAVKVDPFKRHDRVKQRTRPSRVRGKPGQLGVYLVFPGCVQQGSEQIKTQQREVSQVVFGYRFVFQMGVDQAQTAHDSFAKRVITKLRDHHPSFITDNDIFHIAGAVDKDGNLATEVTGKLNETGSQVM